MAAFKIGLHPEDLSRYTFPLFLLHLRGWHAGQKESWRRTATVTCAVLNQWSKRKITPDEMLGEKDDSTPLLMSKAAFEAFMRKRIAEASRQADGDDWDWGLGI